MTPQTKTGLFVFAVAGGAFLFVLVLIGVLALTRSDPPTKPSESLAKGAPSHNRQSRPQSQKTQTPSFASRHQTQKTQLPSSGTSGPSASPSATRDWDLTTLVEFLRHNGFPKTRTFKGGIGKWLILDDGELPDDRDDDQTRRAKAAGAVQYFIKGPFNPFEAETYNRNRPDNTKPFDWAWNAFIFHGNADWIAKLQKCLGN